LGTIVRRRIQHLKRRNGEGRRGREGRREGRRVGCVYIDEGCGVAAGNKGTFFSWSETDEIAGVEDDETGEEKERGC